MHFHPSQLLPALPNPPALIQSPALQNLLPIAAPALLGEQNLGKTNGLALAEPPGVRFLLPFMRLFFFFSCPRSPTAASLVGWI